MAKGGRMTLSKDTKNVLYAIAILFVIVLLISLFAGSLKRSSASTNAFAPFDVTFNRFAAFENFANDDSPTAPKVVLFHATWCHFCVEYLKKGTFDQVAKMDEVKGVSFVKYDADEHKDLITEYGVSSFPTIVGVNSKGEKVSFDKDRESVKDLVAFAKSLL